MKTKFTGRGMKIGLTSILCLLLSFSLMAQETKQISGVVTDTQGNLLPGVTVVVKGTSNGLITGIDGDYTINAPANSVLQYSFIGMISQEVTVADQTKIDITLQGDMIGLEEVVAVGYGTQRKADLTGAVSTVEGERLVKAATPNLANSLGGMISGVTAMNRSSKPGAEDVDFVIRGQSTFEDNNGSLKNNAPLVLVDGVERGMSKINPQDIESLVVLKDAGSAAIYGVKGANGVILITTKRAKEGKAEISYSYNFGLQSPMFLPGRMNSVEYATHLNRAMVNNGQDPQYSDEEIEKLRTEGPNTNWWDETMDKSAPIHTHNVVVSNGNAKIRTRTSFEVLDQKGLYDASSYKRYNFRSNLDTEITKSLKMNLNISYRLEDRNEAPEESSMFQSTTVSHPDEPAYIEINGEQELHWNGFNNTPIGESQTGDDNRRYGTFESSIGLMYDAKFLPGLTAKYTFSFDRTNHQRKTFRTPYTFYTGPDPIDDKKTSMASIDLTHLMREWTNKTGNLVIDYNKKTGDHSFGATFVFEHRDYYNEWIEAYRDGFISDAIDQMFAGSSARWANDGKANENARIGYAGRVNYNYKDKYLLQANIRYDKSFNFPKDNAGGYFPAFSGAWRLSNESFLQDVSWLSNLKLRVGYGIYGNDRITPFQYLSTFGFSSTRGNPSGTIFGGDFYQGIGPDAIPNPNVTWETARNFNIGVDFGLFNNKLSGDFEVYKKRTEDLLIAPKNIPVEVGSNVADTNVGTTENKGFESNLRYKNTFGKLKMNITGTVTYATSEIIEMTEAANIPDGLKQTGRPFGSRYGLISLGKFVDEDDIANSPNHAGYFGSAKPGDLKYKDISGPDGTPDDVIDGYDRTYIGKGGLPEWDLGLNLYFEYNGFELSAFFNGKTGYTHRYMPAPFVNSGNGLQAFTDSWTPDNPNSWLPRTSLGWDEINDAQSDYWLTDGWFVKLRTAEFAYNVPKLALTDKLGINNLRVYVSGSNLFSVSNIDLWDPESADLGTHPMYYMPMRTYNCGVQVTF